jgi:hypothetical protein
MADNEVNTLEETRSAQVNVRLTPSEKADVILVAAFDASNESETLRNNTVDEIRIRAAEIRSMRPQAAA